jgi:hypothetical protein
MTELNLPALFLLTGIIAILALTTPVLTVI